MNLPTATGTSMTQKTIFVSYMHEDKPLAEQIVGQLKHMGYAVWFDEINLPKAGEVDRPIRKAIDKAHYVVACLSRNWQPRPNRYMSEELAYAGESLARDPLRRNLIVPVVLDEHELPTWFARQPLFTDAAHAGPVSPYTDDGAIDVSAILARLSHLEKGYWSTVLAQVSDSRCNIGVVPEAEFVTALKYNALLFDAIEVVPSDLLSNRFFANVLHDHEAARVLLATETDGNPGVIRPVSYNRASFSDIAERMIAARTTHGQGSNRDLMEHARFMDSLSPTRLLFDNPRFRKEYHAILVRGLEQLIEERNESYGDCLEWKTWLDQQDPDTFSQTDAWHFIDANYTASRRTTLKTMSDTGYQTTLARSVGSRVTVAPDSVAPADAMHAVAGSRAVCGDDDRQLRSVDTALATLDVARLSFRDIGVLRDGVSNRRLRAALALPAWRRSPEMAMKAVETEADAFSSEVREILRKHRRRQRSFVEPAARVSLRILSAQGVVDSDPMLVFGEKTVEEAVLVPRGARAQEPTSPLAHATATYAWPQGPNEVDVSSFRI